MYQKDKNHFDSPYATPSKKRRLSHIPLTLTLDSPDDSDFIADESELDDEVLVIEDTLHGDVPSLIPRSRAAARKARQNIQSAFARHQNTYLANVPKLIMSSKKLSKTVAPYMAIISRPEIEEVAKHFNSRFPVWLEPSILSANRLKVDSDSIYLYAADGCATLTEMWTSALSSARFRGPRRHAPFCELHRLTDPDPKDQSGWAENICWAKEQFKAFGSETWTE